MKTKIIIFLCLTLWSFNAVIAQQVPGAKQTKTIAITGATAHIGNGEVINNSLIILKDGKITTIGDAETIKIDLSNMTVIQAGNQHVYPGFILPNSTLGLIEIDAVKASDDVAEMGAWNPNIRSLIAYNAESKIVESMRPNGVLIGQITPRGGVVSGTSSVVQFDAWNWEDAAIKVDDGIHMNWPDGFTRGRWWLGEDPSLKPNKKYNEQINKVAKYFDDAKAYNQGNKTITNLPFESLNGLYDASKRLYIYVNDEKGILDAIDFSKKQGIKNIAIKGGREAYKITEVLKSNNIPVVLQRIHSRPNNEDDDYDLSYKSAKLLLDKGILVALESSGDMERMNSRNLPFYAGTTVAHGLTKEQALQLITLNAAKVLGIDSMYGSLEIGKSATLFISKGDALDMRTNKISHAFIDGRMLSLETYQTKLWKRYSKKLEN